VAPIDLEEAIKLKNMPERMKRASSRKHEIRSFSTQENPKVTNTVSRSKISEQSFKKTLEEDPKLNRRMLTTKNLHLKTSQKITIPLSRTTSPLNSKREPTEDEVSIEDGSYKNFVIDSSSKKKQEDFSPDDGIHQC
jgi:hypothetical protein